MAQGRLVLALPARNRDFGRIFARLVCGLFAVFGALPLLAGFVLSTSTVKAWAANETTRILREQLGVSASFRVELKLLPLRMTVEQLVVPASDGGTPALEVTRIAVTPRIFSLLSGRLDAGDVEVDQPKGRLVLKDGQVQNLAYHLPEPSKKPRAPSKQAPFSSLSVGDARFSLDIDGVHVDTGEIDLDVFAEQGPTFEVALRASGSRLWRQRVVRGVPPPPPGTLAMDEDTLCRLELRLRYEPGDILVRRLSALGAADLDPKPGTLPTCDSSRDDLPGRVVLRLSQVRVGLRKGEVPLVDGHVVLRAPAPLLNRFVRAGTLVGVVAFSGDVRYDGRHQMPEVHGKLTGTGVEFERFKLAKKLDVDLDIAGDVIDIPHYMMTFADGDVVLKNAHIEPFAPGVVLRADRVDSRSMTFHGLMRDLGVTPDTLIHWDFDDLRVTKIAGTIKPLKIDAEVYADTRNFEVTDVSYRDPRRKRMIGVKSALVRGHLGVRPTSFDIYDTRTDFGQSSIFVKLVSIAFADAAVKMSVPKGAHIDLGDISPIVGIPIAGKAEVDVDMTGVPPAVVLAGNMAVKDFVFGGFPFGDITSAKVHFVPLILDLLDVQAKKGKTDYAVPSARLNFDGPASLVTDAHMKSDSFDLRDFFHMWHFDTDPRFDDIRGKTALDATVHYVLGGPEDPCGGGNLRVAGGARFGALDLFDERYDSGDAQFDFRWIDRDATYQGVDLSVPSLTLHKGSGTLVGSLGMRQGGKVYGHFVGSAVPLSHLDALPTVLRAADGQLSAVAEVGGTVDALTLSASGRISPIRVGRATLPASKFEVNLVPIVREQKVVGTTRCGKPTFGPFDRGEYDADASTGAFHASADLFGGQIKFDDLTISRQRAKVVHGDVAFTGLDLGVMAELSPALGDSETRLDGKLSGKLGLHEFRMKTPLESRVDLTLSEVDLTRQGYRVQLASGAHSVAFENGRFTLPGLGFTATTPRGQRVTFDAQGSIFNVATFPQINAKLVLRPMQLASLVGVIPRAERAEGVLSGQLEVQGPLLAPRFSGGFDLEHGELAIRGLPLPVSDIDLALRIDGNELRVERGSAKVGAGTLQVSGGAPLLGMNLGAARFAITARGLALPMNEGIRAVADADLAVTFKPVASGEDRELPRVTGDVTLNSFDYTRPVVMTADISSLAQRGKRTEVVAFDPADDVVQFEVRLRSTKAMKLQNNLIDAELDVADEGLLLAGTNGRFGLRGGVILHPRGKIFLRRSEFEVTQGRVRFDDLTRIAPEVDVTAVTEYRRYQTNTPATSAPTSTSTSSGGSSAPTSQGGRWRIQLHAHGDADKLKVDLTSDPALAQDDIFLLLTVGLTRAELDQAQSASVGESVALEALGSISGADRAVTDAVPLIDEFRFGSSYSSRTGRTEPTVTIGKRLSKRIRANVTSGVADSREVRSNVEWQLSPRVSVEGSYDNVNDISSSTLGNLGADVRWRLEFE